MKSRVEEGEPGLREEIRGPEGTPSLLPALSSLGAHGYVPCARDPTLRRALGMVESSAFATVQSLFIFEPGAAQIT